MEHLLRAARLALVCVVSASLLGSCAQGSLSTQTSRIGPDDGTDSCRRYLVALDSMGDYFGADILKGAAIGAVGGALAGGLLGGDTKGALTGAGTGALLGGAAAYWTALQQQSQDQAVLTTQVRDDITRENGQIDSTQLAFDALMDCRFRQAQAIQADYAAHRTDRPAAVAQMATVKQRAELDLTVARRIDGQITGRAQQFEVAADKLQPAPAAPKASVVPVTRSAVVRHATPLKLNPDPGAPDIGALQPRQSVQLTASRNGYAMVETPLGQRGYALLDAFKGSPPPPPSGDSGDVRTLAGSNAARRDGFTQSVSVTDQAVSSGFELAG